MKKKNYVIPTCKVYKVRTKHSLLTTSVGDATTEGYGATTNMDWKDNDETPGGTESFGQSTMLEW